MERIHGDCLASTAMLPRVLRFLHCSYITPQEGTPIGPYARGLSRSNYDKINPRGKSTRRVRPLAAGVGKYLSD